ncbi:MAG: SDR family oxidoreductase [Aggregatilineales bacterium]
MRLANKVALVTGAASERSIGWGIAKALAEEGADIVVNDVVQGEQLGLRATEIMSLGRRALAVTADVTNAEAVDEMMALIIERFGHLDIVASNAGVIRWENFLNITPENMRAIVDVNIMGNVNICRAVAKQLIAQKQGGRIIITSSVQADYQFPISTVYGATKKAMHTFVGGLATELAEYQITVNHIGPGWVRSSLNDPAPGQQSVEDIEQQRRSIPLRRDGLIEEMGRAVVYFATADGDYTTGAFIRVDGGLGIGKYVR